MPFFATVRDFFRFTHKIHVKPGDYPLVFSRHRFGRQLAEYQTRPPRYDAEKNRFVLKHGVLNTHERMGKPAGPLVDYAHDFFQRICDHTQASLIWKPRTHHKRAWHLFKRRGFTPVTQTEGITFFEKVLRPEKKTATFTPEERQALRHILKASGWKTGNKLKHQIQPENA
ncbi:MAG: hypothetical protein Q8P02_05385 [Candidatus Micrarchaeota archaeon]|nr:hypothetical protein [Candidatus Micrarchaeota archaeon]